MTSDEARAAFDTARVARLASVASDGAPHLVPIVFALDGNAIVTAVDAKPKRSTALRRLGNIAANPRVTLLVDGYDDDWDRLWWARADGAARVVDDGPDHRRAIDLLHARYAQYATVEISGPVVVVEVARWSGWEATELARDVRNGRG